MHSNSGYSAKKTIATFFLLLAGTILLAHAVISHHHHDETHITDQCTTPHRCLDDCSLSNIYMKIDNDILIFQLHDFSFDLFPYCCALLPDFSKHQVSIDIGLPFRQKPYLQSYHTQYVSQSLGLRAPPFITIN